MVAADRGDASKTKALINDFIVAAGVGNELIQRSALAGERDLANELAAELDSRAHRFLELMIASYQCMCGAPFDLTAARKFTELMADAALPGHLYRRLTGR